MKAGKLQLGVEAIQVDYELNTVTNGTVRETKGKLVLKQNPLGELAHALMNGGGANLVEDDGNVRWIEFTKYSGMNVEFVALPPRAR